MKRITNDEKNNLVVLSVAVNDINASDETIVFKSSMIQIYF